MKRFYLIKLIVLLVFISNITFAQTIDENAQDGKLYFKIKNSEKARIIPEMKGRKVNLEQTAFLNKINDDFNLEWVERAFYLENSSEDLKSIYRVSFTNFSQVNLLIRAFEELGFIEYAEKVPFYKVLHTPNDYLYNETNTYNWNWHLDIINAGQAWDISTGDANIKVAVVDGAIWAEHPDLINKVIAQKSYVSPTTSSSPPSSVSQSSSLSAYEWSHGTHCAGLIAAESNNSIGVASIGYNVSLMAYRAGDDNGDLYYTGYGEEWAANNGADVISMSYGGPTYSSSENTWYNNLKSSGIICIAAAGNDGVNTESYPAGYAAVIAVASVDEDFALSSFSQYGSWVDIAAPGGYEASGAGINLVSTTYTEAYYLESIYFFENTNYDGMQGTSMACPVTAGLCGLLLSINPALTPDEVENCLKTTSQTTSGNSIESGSGCIDAYAAAQCAQSSSTLTANFSANSTNINEGQSVNFTDLSADGGTTITGWSWSFPGGSPSSSTSPNPTNITYASAGDYDVTLTVSNGSSDTETKTNYIHVATPSTTYCPSSGNTTYATSITLVNLNTINNSTGQTSPYEDYTSISTDLEVGDSYNLTVNVNTDGNYLVFGKVWIDWNHDYDFDDAGELFEMGDAADVTNGPTANSPLSITVPSGATVGATRMRVSAKYEDPGATEGTATSCEEDYDGEVEDYTINITDASVNVKNIEMQNNINIYPNPNKGQFVIDLNNEKQASIKIYDINGRTILDEQQVSTKKTYNLSELQSGIYVVKIITENNISTKKVTIK